MVRDASMVDMLVDEEIQYSYTVILNLVKKTSDHDNPCMIASRIFQTIGYAVMDSPETASLSKHSLNDLLQLFDDDSSTITILYNIPLNQILKQMAEIMSSNISRANKEVATNIQKCVRNSNQ
ncbi:hypothetical protein INT47_007683 [Mucor saturninus]|uniref:Uncharacterized protein n=1 Tax=Mucor saturninus TaxID=64648 RepID=A0A8H7QJ31_9FUNG|nr:hypothetical protein INT47_007683 [Mucor saturninus]